MKLPETFENNMKELLGGEFLAYKNCLDEPMRHGIRINESKISVEDFLRINPFLLKEVPWCKNGFYYDENVDKPSKHPYYYAGLYYIQEPSAMTPASILPIDENDRVLDVCAAPGGKSTELASRLAGTGVLISNDISASRAKALLKNLEVFGADNYVITSENTHKLSERFEGYFDKILVDAPCSGEGMFRKSQSMITAWENNGNQMFADIQRTILSDVVRMLKPGGYMVYSTCTFSPLENECSIEYLLSLDESMEIVAFDKNELFDDGHPEWSEKKDGSLKKCARLWPHRLNGEGHFVTLLRKKDEGQSIYSQCGRYDVRKIKLDEAAREFLSRINKKFDEDRLEINNDRLYYIASDIPDVKGLRTLRTGLLLGEIKKNRFEPSQALAMTLKKDEFDNLLDLSINDERVIKYLKGETIEAEGKNGWILVCVDSYPLGWGKLNNGLLKNKYLAGWRLMS
ncbi:MAG: RsmF rRNA methyltransferase first C-terminal domain-containing protein [Lachnospiraceae bacterium]|nr:RsmF rRNA methyltransferase first C-terminal domain-containing protein [Lachnospiraceae bacterium]